MSQIDPKQIHEDATYFLSKLNIGASFLDARAFQIMNNNLGIGDMLKEIEELRKQNELYRLLQGGDSFVFLDGIPDHPWTDEEVAIIDRHNTKLAGQPDNSSGHIEAENIRLKSLLKFYETQNDPVRAIRILRKCGFPPVVNPNIESSKDRAIRNLWYFKAAMYFQEYDINLFDADVYEAIKNIMPVNIPHTISKETCEQHGLHFETMREVLPLAVVLYENIERMTEEVFGDAETPR